MDLSEPNDPGIFNDLTSSELRSIRQYLQSAKDLNLASAEQSTINKSFIYTADLFLPSKSNMLLHLDMDIEKPAREARVIIFRGDLKPAIVQEYIVGPLRKPEYHYMLKSNSRKNPIPDAFKPLSMSELDAVMDKFLNDINWQLSRILQESYDAVFLECDSKCLKLIPVPLSPELSMAPARKLLFQAFYDVKYYSLFPLDLMFLFHLNGTDKSSFYLDQIVYADQIFNSVKELQYRYIEGAIHKTAIPFPVPDSRSFTDLEGEGADWHNSKRKPRLVEPDGHRYSIHHQHISYMNWNFHYRLSTLTGPALYDVNFGKERIAFEISLQEIAAHYSSSSTGAQAANFVHGSFLLGTQAKSLIPGTDCPETATFISSSFMAEKSSEPYTTERAICLFELNSGTPLRRHLAYTAKDDGFYDGMADSSLVLRTVFAISNHDYIIDYIFHQNGVLETQVTPAGHLRGMFHSGHQERYGYQLTDHLAGVIQQQLFHFKVDLDVFGTSNRYQTLKVQSKRIANGGRPFSQLMYKYDLKQTEMEAAFSNDRNIPTYHLFYNNRKKTEHHVLRAIRVDLGGSPVQLSQETPLSWSNYQIAVTKYKPDERSSSSPYAAYDSTDPVVNFTKYIEDNDNLIDKDLVLWITMCIYNIPHSEELPLISSVNKHRSFYLIPFNYFPSDPSRSSKDSVRAVHNDTSRLDEGIRFLVDDSQSYQRCIMNELNLTTVVDNPDSVLETEHTRTIL
ncbi:hypothetical protein LOTGIDRAFT_118163 [Lottia gigantea]|uniref:Amine oxidase n=1 Tax=Lottia gigantea TaxID=225164 RepID=V4BZ83_LOTGI|nr:hypothetical protein LOTGIDRAFT_118163 [Lottia gigantea]ESO94444.1 hypothetical protein LOTGIDRAFT_118163 [Lottia gigantea]